MSQSNLPPQEESKQRGYELSDAKARPLLVWAGILGAVIITCLIVGHSMVKGFEEEREAAAKDNPLENYQARPQETLLQAETGEELEAYRMELEELSTSYGWVDRPNGIVRVPLERALELTLERGLPSVENAPHFDR